MKSAAPQDRILIIPHDFLWISLRLPKHITRAGFAVDVMCLPHQLVGYSRHVESVIFEATPELLFQRLKSILSDPAGPWKAVVIVDEPLLRRVIATGDPVIMANWQKGIFREGVRDFYLSKIGLEFVYQNDRIRVPPTKTCHSKEQIHAFGETHGWPIVVKPPDSTNGMGVIECDSGRDVRDLVSDADFPTLAQKFVSGRELVVDMLCAGGKVLAWLASQPTRRTGGRFAGSTARKYLSVPELRPLVEQVAEFTRFEGFCGFDCIEDESTGTYSLIEFHPRPTVGFRYARDCGVDLSPAISTWIKGVPDDDFAPITQQEDVMVDAYNFPRDIARCWDEKDWRGLGPWLPGSGARHDIFLDDFPLFAAWAASSARDIWRALRKWTRR